MEGGKDSLLVEPLKPNHLLQFAQLQQIAGFDRMEINLVKGWISQYEILLNGFIPIKSPLCMVAIEKGKLIAFVKISPCNHRGTCWSVAETNFINESKKYNKNFVKSYLLQHAFDSCRNIAQNWLLRCPSSNKELLSISRELGFQPLKIVKTWNPSNEMRMVNSSDTLKAKKIRWEEINKTNAHDLIKLEHASQPGHLRHMLDRSWIDIHSNKDKNTSVLLVNDGGNINAIAGLTRPPGCLDSNRFELIRDLAWDERIRGNIDSALVNLNSRVNNLTIETSIEDENINDIFRCMKWKEGNETVLLGKSIWKRKKTINPKFGWATFNSIAGEIDPQQTPIPSP